MALCCTRASLRLLCRLAAPPPHVAGGARRLCVVSAPSRQRTWSGGLLAPAHLALRRAPLCAAAAEDKAPKKKKEVSVLAAELPKGAAEPSLPHCQGWRLRAPLTRPPRRSAAVRLRGHAGGHGGRRQGGGGQGAGARRRG
jgi:hypothetical protein